jgi:cobalt/nickel transport system permease protein
MRLIDRNAQTNRYRRLPALEKLGFAVGGMGVALATHSYCAQGIILLTALGITTLGAGVPAADLRAAAQVPVGFILAGCAAQATGLSFRDGWPHAFWTGDAAAQAAFIGLRSLACVFSLLALALTTPIGDILKLLRRMPLGRDIGDIAYIMLQMVWITLDCLTAGARSQANRLGFVGYRRTIRSLGTLLAALLPRTLGRARRLEVGLAARGFDGELRFISLEHPLSAARLVGFTLVLAAVAVAGGMLV